MISQYKILERARILRKEQTKAEAKIWEIVRNRQLLGLKFKRQVPFGNYILDFYCEQKKVVIEIDGSQHANEEQVKYDKERTRYLEQNGLVVLRLWNDEVTKNVEGIREYLIHKLS